MKVKAAEGTSVVQEYYFSTKLKQIDEMRRGGADIINLGIGSPDLPPSGSAIKKLAEEASKPGVHGYQSYTGLPSLRKAMAEWYKKYFKITLDPESEILPLIGSKEGIMHISMAFIDPGQEVLAPDPGYPTYSSVTRLAGGKVRTYDLKESNGWIPDFNELENSDLSNVKLMWVNYPHMPTGTRSSDILLERIVRFGEKHNILICNDNPYSFILNDDYHSILSVNGSMDIALELNSLSKSHNMAGWRIGMVSGNREYIRTIIKVKSNMDSGMFMPIQAAAAEALSHDDNWHKSLNEVYSKRRKYAEEIMDILGCSFNPTQSGLFLWGRLPESVPDCESFVENILQKAHVFITPGFIFGKNGDRYVRISLCANETNLERAKERITEYISNK